MALTRVQGTPKTTGGTTSLACTFAAPPTVGNAVILSVASLSGATVTGVTDNRGHTYTVARSRTNGGAPVFAAVYYCPILTATGAPFTVTVVLNAAGTNSTIQAVEVSGVGTGLAIDQATDAIATTATPDTGTTAALAASEVFLMAVLMTAAGNTALTVVSASPTWFEEYEAIPFSNPAGEGDTRVLTGAAGSTQSCSWTMTPSSAFCAAVLVAFSGGTAGGGGGAGGADVAWWLQIGNEGPA